MKKILALPVIIVLITIIIFLPLYFFSYCKWRQDMILTQSEYMNTVKKQNEKPAFFYFSVNDQQTIQGIVYFPAICLEIVLFDLDYVEE